MRLAGVGEVGQKRIEQASVTVCADGFVGDVATRYLAGAGVGCLRVKDPELAASARTVDPSVQVVVDSSLEVSLISAPFKWHQQAAADVANGAHVALEILRQALREPA